MEATQWPGAAHGETPILWDSQPHLALRAFCEKAHVYGRQEQALP